jgi:hypothetical protein
MLGHCKLMSKLKVDTERGENSPNPASTNSAPEGVVPQVDSAVLDFDSVKEDELVGFAVEISAGFGGYTGMLISSSIWNLRGINKTILLNQ